MLKNLVIVFFTAMIPVMELRAAIPMGVALNLPVWSIYAAAVLGNMIPVPFIIIFVRRILQWMKGKEGILNRIAVFMLNKADRAAETLFKYELLGLVILVAIPLPGTGAWTGALVAGMFNLRMKVAVPLIFLGVLIAGGIVMALSLGVSAAI